MHFFNLVDTEEWPSPPPSKQHWDEETLSGQAEVCRAAQTTTLLGEGERCRKEETSC